MTSEPRAYIRHLRAEKMCSRGSRDWWKAQGLDWGDFVANGIPVSRLEEIGGPLVARVIAQVKAESDGR